MYPDFADPKLEYEKNPDLKKSDILILEEWVRKQSHLPEVSEMKLIHFLHSNYYNIESSKRAIENYYAIKTNCPEFFSRRDPKDEHVKNALKTSLITVLPVYTKDNYPILLTRLVDIVPENYDLIESFKVIDMVVSLTQMQIGTTPGQIMLMDAKDFSLGHFLRCNINVLRKYLTFVQEASPIRLKAVHVVNISSVTEKFASLVRPFIKKNVYEAVYFHKTVEDLDGIIPKEALPEEMGGTAGTCKELQDKVIKNLEEHSRYFLDDEKQLIDESKRVGALKTATNSFGLEGNFKKLEID